MPIGKRWIAPATRPTASLASPTGPKTKRFASSTPRASRPRTSPFRAPACCSRGLTPPTSLGRVNDIAAELIGRQAGRFGAFAALPLPDVGDSLAELARALDELKLDGIGLMTHHGDVYLGDPRLDEVFDELNRRAATVFIHPTTPLCCGDAFLDYPRPALEFIFDTPRAVMNLIHSGTLDRCPDVNWIIPHGGGALPALSLRLDAVHALAPGRSRAQQPSAAYLGRFHYDLAGPRPDSALQALLGIADESRLLYGSDWPFTPEPGVARMLSDLRETTVFERPVDELLDANAQRLLPRSER